MNLSLCRRADQRCVSVYKNKRKVDLRNGKGNLTSFTFSEEAKMVLCDLFTRYPPDDREVGDEMVKKGGGKIQKPHRKKEDIFCKPSLNMAETAKKLESLASRIEKTPNLRQISEQRSGLPISSFRDVITSTIECHQVFLLSLAI
ncbi:unnamed protein product [Ilex paraguariensis]|uniref:Uncharacterized protein n=1 Tax=Ilex paraguariensis TaxID=185542 RepID=A0ABC8QKQ4_9AQUA